MSNGTFDSAFDPWANLRRFTPARIALGRTGDGLPTDRLLEFQAAHALARDAVHQPFDAEGLADQLCSLANVIVRSQARDRATYLQRPDLGRKLDEVDKASLRAMNCPSKGSHDGYDAVIVLADGLSARALHDHGAALLRLVMERLAGWNLAPIVIARQARVALGDDVAASLNARMVLMLIGERPGLTAADSIGAYLTFQPKPGVTRDAERNCVSNIRPDGLPLPVGADTIGFLMNEARRLKLTGIGLKENRPPELTHG
ncbi:ethanolamine ammonia-lyase subunit EutC [Niveispirillum sp. BGYR6]|uniref:ethanolamine ammonia-lyase subunit EutC n=1 Tax=Niveispirillum sp. BGYR6 TaxID=2971249 RepID=UPI0022B9CCC7|nr:ethanolamine ammonia-lyase subunit EutC [Niveispirillum sp. BGYR6]MDG5497709.1 ethanolamine ammonia-lyase subunit EutC [Niveispirillum sp. BGYR6]